MTIRDATPFDAQAIARVHVETWRTTYPGIMPQAHLDALSVGQFAADWANRIAQGKSRILVAEDDGPDGSALGKPLVGFSSGGPQLTNDPDYSAEIYTIYLLQSHQGQGRGRQLFQAMARRLHRDGHPTMMLWAHVRNPARGFYETMGGRATRTGQRTREGVTYDDVGYGWDEATFAWLISE